MNALVVALSIVLIGCGGRAPAPTAAASPAPVAVVAPPAVAAAPAALTVVAPDLPVVKLVDAGKGPRRRLRFAPTKGMKRTVAMTVEMAVTIDLGRAATTQLPPVNMPFELVVTDVAPNGDFHYVVTMLEPEIVADRSVERSVVEAMQKALVGAAGLVATATVTSRGFSLQGDFKLPANLNPQSRQLLESFEQSIQQLSAPLPEEEVGVGATWQTTTRIANKVISLEQVALTELVALDDTGFTLAIKFSQSAPPQTITSDGTAVDLERFTGSGGGESTFGFGEPAPRKGHMTATSDMRLRSGSQQMGMGFETTMKMTSR